MRGWRLLRLSNYSEPCTKDAVEKDFKPLSSLGAKFGKSKGNVIFDGQCCSHEWFSPVASNCIGFDALMQEVVASYCLF